MSRYFESQVSGLLEKVNILGVEYDIIVRAEEDDDNLQDNYSYCDMSTKQIVVCSMRDLINKEPIVVGDLDVIRDHCIRHEIIHAMLYESGLNTTCDFAINEEAVDWIALQFHKLRKIFEEIEV